MKNTDKKAADLAVKVTKNSKVRTDIKAGAAAKAVGVVVK